ncbi:MAG: DNA translocase FtsK [Nitrospirales bacterium]|nr:DNA translocase FtsK [Nitrospirales bacterium]
MSIFTRLNLHKSKPLKIIPSRLSYEILSIAFLTFGILVFLSLWSFSPTRISLPNEPLSPSDNLIGSVGETTASALFLLAGWASYAIPFLIVLYAARLFQEGLWMTKARSIMGSIVMVTCLGGLVQQTFSSSGGEVGQYQQGGLIGQWLAGFLGAHFAEVGSVIVLLSMLMVSLLLITPSFLTTTGTKAAHIWPFVKATGQFLSTLSFRRQDGQPRVKPNKPVKINRSMTVRGGVATLPYDANAHKPDELLAFSDAPGEPTVTALATSAIEDTASTVNEFPKVSDTYQLPDPTQLLDPPPVSATQQTDHILETQSKILTGALQSFGIGGKVTEVHPGPVITMYEFEPAPGIKVARIVTLAHDLAMALKAVNIRIVAPLPGKSTVGIEVPNPFRETVSFRTILTSDVFTQSRSQLTLALGKDIFGRPVVADLQTMPHLLVAGATGSGKSVGLNSMLLSMLFSAHPDDVKLLLIDPKVLELQVYDGIPHLLRPVLTNPKAAAKGLSWAVQEMERRYLLLAEHGVRNIQSFNHKVTKNRESLRQKMAQESEQPVQNSPESFQEACLAQGESTGDPTPLTPSVPDPLPYIVVVIDEFADLMMIAPKEIEEKIARLAQMARASGIHLILATQRPSVDVVTGLIKANFPSRIAFQVSSKIDSRTILDANGAEALLGQGDMLYMASGTGRITRLHGSYVSDEDVAQVVQWVKDQAGPHYQPEEPPQDLSFHDEEEQARDETYEQARELIMTSGQASASLIQRRLRVGYPRAARMIEQMEGEGLVSTPGRDGRREVLVRQMAEQERLS